MADMTRDEILALAERHERDVREDEAWSAGGNVDSAPTAFVRNRMRRNATIARALRLLAGEMGEPGADDWRDDPSQDERWNEGVNYAITQLCEGFGVDPKSISWDAATETVDGDVSAVLGNVLRAAYGEEWSSGADTTAIIRSALVSPPPIEDPVRAAALDWHQAGQDLHAAVIEGRSNKELQDRLYAAEERLNLACRALAPKEG